MRTQQILGACEYTLAKYGKELMTGLIGILLAVKLFVSEASPLAYVSFCQQSIAEKHRTLFVCHAQWSLLSGRPLIAVLSQEKERKGLEKVSQYADKSYL